MTLTEILNTFAAVVSLAIILIGLTQPKKLSAKK